MTNALRSTISDLAATFAASIVTAIRSSNLEDILGLSGGEAAAPVRRGPGRPPRAGGRTGTGTLTRLAGGGRGSSGVTAGGGGQPDPLVLPVKATTAAPAKRASASGKGTAAKKTASSTTKAASTRKAAGKPARLPRRSPAEIAKALAQVVALVKSDTGGLRAEQIGERLGMTSKEMPRVLKEGLATKVLKSKGVKRSTTYTAA